MSARSLASSASKLIGDAHDLRGEIGALSDCVEVDHRGRVVIDAIDPHPGVAGSLLRAHVLQQLR